MKPFNNLCIPYCLNCDAYSHDIEHCKEYKQFKLDFKTRGTKATIERYGKCENGDEVYAIEEELLQKLQ